MKKTTLKPGVAQWEDDLCAAKLAAQAAAKAADDAKEKARVAKRRSKKARRDFKLARRTAKKLAKLARSAEDDLGVLAEKVAKAKKRRPGHNGVSR